MFFAEWLQSVIVIVVEVPFMNDMRLLRIKLVSLARPSNDIDTQCTLSSPETDFRISRRRPKAATASLFHSILCIFIVLDDLFEDHSQEQNRGKTCPLIPRGRKYSSRVFE